MSTATLSKKVAAELKKFGIKAKGYVSTPEAAVDNKDVFLLSLDENDQSVRVWPGIAQVEVKGSKTHKQAVLNVVEKQRVITHEVEFTRRFSKKPGNISADLRERFISNFPIALPNRDVVSWDLTDFKSEVEQDAYPSLVESTKRYKVSATVTATVPTTTQSFLVGQDETSQFISMLPKKAKSVEEAHKILRPKRVTSDAIRQGEWFFQPVSEALSKILDAKVAEQPDIMDDVYPLDKEGDESTHWCTQVTLSESKYKGKYAERIFTIGWVTDRRRRLRTTRRRSGRRTFSHHAPLFLADWHEIIKNREIEPPPSLSGQARTWD